PRSDVLVGVIVPRRRPHQIGAGFLRQSLHPLAVLLVQPDGVPVVPEAGDIPDEPLGWLVRVERAVDVEQDDRPFGHHHATRKPLSWVITASTMSTGTVKGSTLPRRVRPPSKKA